MNLAWGEDALLPTWIAPAKIVRSHSTNAKGGYVHNPHSKAGQPLSAGGSSGGSAVAVATNACDVYTALNNPRPLSADSLSDR